MTNEQTSSLTALQTVFKARLKFLIKRVLKDPVFGVGELCMGLFDELRCALIRKRALLHSALCARHAVQKRRRSFEQMGLRSSSNIDLHCTLMFHGFWNF